MFIVLSLCFVGHLQHCDHLVGEEGAGCFACRWLVTRMLSLVGSSLFLFVSIGRLCSVIVVLPGNIYIYLSFSKVSSRSCWLAFFQTERNSQDMSRMCMCACVRTYVYVNYITTCLTFIVPSVSNVPNLSCCAVFIQDSYSQDMSRICSAYYSKIAICSSVWFQCSLWRVIVRSYTMYAILKLCLGITSE